MSLEHAIFRRFRSPKITGCLELISSENRNEIPHVFELIVCSFVHADHIIVINVINFTRAEKLVVHNYMMDKVRKLHNSKI